MGKERPTGVVFSGEHLRWEAPSRGKEPGEAQSIEWRELPEGEELPREELRALPAQGGCLVALSGADVMLRPLVFPTTDTAELAGMVDLQVDQISPFGTDESTSSYEVVAQLEGQSHVIVGICRTARIEATAGVLRRAGLAVERIESELLTYWYVLAEGGHLDAEKREVVLLLVESGLYLMIQEQGLPLVLSLQATPDELQDPSLVDDLRQTVAHELTGLEVQHGSAVGGHVLLLCGEGAPLNALGAAVGQACGCVPRELALEQLGSVSGAVMTREAAVAAGSPMDLTPLSWRVADRAIAFHRRMWRDKKLGAIGGLVFLLFLLCGVFANVLAPYGMNETNLLVRLESPSLAHWFGTDHLGRDILSRIIGGAGISLEVGFVVVVLPA